MPIVHKIVISTVLALNLEKSQICRFHLSKFNFIIDEDFRLWLDEIDNGHIDPDIALQSLKIVLNDFDFNSKQTDSNQFILIYTTGDSHNLTKLDLYPFPHLH